jgi:hypothetical protein
LRLSSTAEWFGGVSLLALGPHVLCGRFARSFRELSALDALSRATGGVLTEPNRHDLGTKVGWDRRYLRSNLPTRKRLTRVWAVTAPNTAIAKMLDAIAIIESESVHVYCNGLAVYLYRPDSARVERIIEAAAWFSSELGRLVTGPKS